MATKKPLSVPKKGTEKAPEVVKPAATTPLQKMLHPEVKEENRRTTIVVNPELYKEFKAYAATAGTTVTALLNDAMREILGK